MSTLPTPATTSRDGPNPLLPGLSVVLACFDDDASIAAAIREAAGAAARTSADYEIVVVDDGSRDGTVAAASQLVEHGGRVRLLVHPHPRGYGAALRTGIGAARMPWVLLTDADLQFDPQALEDFARLATSADVVVGRRVLRSDSLGRRANGAAWNWLVRKLFALGVHDVDCGFKLIRRERLQQAALTSNGTMISAELLVRLRAGGATIAEHPVRQQRRVPGAQDAAHPRFAGRGLRELVAQQRTLRRLSHG